MLEVYQARLNRCIDIQEGRQFLDKFQKMNKIMKGNMEMLRKKSGKHSVVDTEELEKTIELKDEAILNIQTECARQFKLIKDLCFCNEYDGINGKDAKLRKIYEIASDNFSDLVNDIAITKFGEKIELPKTDQSAR